MAADLFGRRIEIEGLEILGVVQATAPPAPTWTGRPYRVTFELVVREVETADEAETADGERILMTPEQAAEQAAHVLHQAAAWADNPETVSGFVQVADGWTRLHTALKMGQSELVTVNMSGTTIREEPAPGEPAETADLPDGVLALVDAVNQMREDWRGADQARRKKLWHQVRRYSDATWRLACDPPTT